MKNVIRPILYLQMTALFLAASLASLAAAEKQTPFRGTIQAVETGEFQFPTVFVAGSGTGNATHFGRFTASYEAEVDVETEVAAGTEHFIAANGDTLSTKLIGHSYPTEDPDVVLIVNAHSITGGTGRFAGATGSFTEKRLLNLVTGISSGSLDGTISL